MSRKREYISLKTKLAAAIGALFLTYEERTKLSEDQVLSLCVWDHDPIPHAHGGPDSHDNLTPRLIAEHRVKTATADTPAIAKARRIGKAETEFRARLLAPRSERPTKKSNFPKGRKLVSRNSFKRKERAT